MPTNQNTDGTYTDVLAALFQAHAEEFDADEFFRTHAKRLLTKLGIEMGREGVIRFSTVLAYVERGAFDLGDLDPVFAAILVFEYLKVEAKDSELEFEYDGDSSPTATTPKRTRGGSKADQLIDHYGSEAKVRSAFRKHLKKEVKTGGAQGALSRAARAVTDESKVTLNAQNPRLMFEKFDVDVDAILREESGADSKDTGSTRGKSSKSAKQQIIDHKDLGDGSEAAAKRKLVSMLKKAAKEGRRGAIASVGHQLIDDFKIKMGVANAFHVLSKSFEIDTNAILDEAAPEE